MNLYAAHCNWLNRGPDERFKSLAQMHAAVCERNEMCVEHDCGMRDYIPMLVEKHMALQPVSGGTPLRLTHWSATQVFNRLRLRRGTVERLLPVTANDALNQLWWHESTDGGRCDEPSPITLYRGSDGALGGVARSVTSTKYTRLRDDVVTTVLMNGLPDNWRNPYAYARGKFGEPMEPSGLYASDRDMFAFFIDGGDALEVGDSKLHRGFFVWNSEVGSRSVGFTSFYFDRTCGNHIVWGATNVRSYVSRHTGTGPMRIVDGLKRFLGALEVKGASDVFNDSTFIETVRAASRDALAPLTAGKEASEERASVLGDSFSKGEIAGAWSAILAERPHATGSRWDWLSGFTAHARTLRNMDDRLDLDTRAAQLL